MYPTPTGQMSNSFQDQMCSCNYPMPCCSHGYNYYYYYYPPGPMMPPYPHMYPPCVASSPPMPYHYGLHLHHQPMPASPNNSHLPTNACFPVQHHQPFQYPLCRPNGYFYHGNPVSSGDGVKVRNEDEDVKRVESAMNDGSNSLQPQFVWIPPQYLENLRHSDEGKGVRDGKNGVQLIPFDSENHAASLYDKDGSKPMTSSVQKDFPFPIIFMPHGSDSTKGKSATDRITRIDEKPLKLLGDGAEKTVPPEPVKKSEMFQDDSAKKEIQTQKEKVKVKDIPVKQVRESNDTKPSSYDAVKCRSRSVSPTKTSKLPPVCLRVDPLPKKKNGNGTRTQSSLQQSSQNGKLSEAVNSEKKREESEVKKMHHQSTDKANDVKVVEASFKESPMTETVSSIDEDGKVRNTKENANVGELVESVKKSAQPETPAELKESPDHGLNARKIISEETAAVRIQSAYRGYEERKWQSLHKLRQIAKVCRQISCIRDRVQALENVSEMKKEEFERERITLGELIMSHLLTLDTIQGLHPSVRDIRKSVARELIGLQERLDLLHAQRLKESEQGTEPGRGDATDNSDVKEVPCRNGTEEQYTNNAIDAEKQQDNKQEECVQINSSEDNNENLAKINDALQEDLRDDSVQTEDAQEGTQAIANETTPKGNSLLDAVNNADLNVLSTEDELNGRDKENLQNSKLEEQPSKGSIDCSSHDAVSEQEVTGNCEVVAVAPETDESKHILLESVEELSKLSCSAIVENDVVSDEGPVDSEQVSTTSNESELRNYDETSEHVCNNLVKQPEERNLESGTENSCEEVKDAPNNTNVSEEFLSKMDEVDKEAQSGYVSVNKHAEEFVELEPTREITGEDSQEDMPICEPAGSDLQNSRAASAEDAHDKVPRRTESEESLVTYNSCATCSLKAADTEFELCEKGIQKLEAPEDVNPLCGNDEALIDEHETPRLSSVSRTSTETLDSVVLAEENGRLRETLKKLMESEKEKLEVISTLNERLRKLEKMQRKKRSRKVKLHSGGMMKAAHKNNNGNIPVCSM